MREWFRIEAAAKGKGGGDILIYGSIGKSWWDEDAVSAKAFVKELDALIKAGPGDVHIRINSPGGNVGDGMAIYNSIRNVKERCYATIEGTAYSMASVIALAGRETRMHDTGQFMVHNPIVSAYGGEKEMESAIKALKVAKTVLVKAYTAKTGKSKAEVEEIMGDTTFMTADEAKEFGFVDAVIEGDELQKVAACFDASAWAAYYQGVGELPRGEETPEQTEEEGGGGVPETNGAETPEEERVMPKLTAKEIREACPGASAEFVLGQVEACESDENRGIEHVLKAHNAELAAQVQMANATAAAAQAAAEAAQNRQAPGVAPVAADGPAGDEQSGDPIAAWDEAVGALVAKGMNKQKAIGKLSDENPEGHKAYLAAYNALYGVGESRR